MATAEEKRLDLYNGLQEALGTERATTLMTYLPSIESPDPLTKTEFNEFRSEIRDQFARVNSRIDRVLLAVVGSLVAIVAAVFTTG